MTNIQTPSNRRFWAVPSGGVDPLPIGTYDLDLAVHEGKSMYLRLRLFHNQAPKRAPSRFACLVLEGAYQDGYAAEAKEFGHVERS
jgi:hypothetical protein